jgi:hypothetical protein
MPVPQSILARIETFRSNIDSYISPEYKEAQVRQEFIDPLFTALGWDVGNVHGYAEAYKEVVSEDTLRISGAGTKAPDYSFRIGGTRKFFVEAKKPAVYLKDDPEPARQLRVYSWSAKLSLGIVTDFQEFAIYDTSIRPKEGDKASVARIFYCTFEEYPEKWDYIASILSKDAVLKGSFDRHAASAKGKRGTTEFDDAFLQDMEDWRGRLARNLAIRNTKLSQRDLNFSVQRILDRIIFLRIAEDRGIERYGQLQALTAGPKIYPRFCDICRHADLRYNSGLFHFEDEKGREESPDKLTLSLAIDDSTLKEIIGALYYPKSPYAFAVIPADILGHVYEQFLGKVITLTDGHHAKVVEKPEVRKAGGVYYTPTYIVDYIVTQTVGALVDGKSPLQVAKIKVLDPACGSGSFLLGAYEFLLDWHLKYYLAHDPATWAKKKNPPIYETSPNAKGLGQGSGNWQLTTAERKRILLNNLHGVDIDAQAVEVTKLSLLLKVLEGEARELRGKQQLDFHRVLPDLGKNIKCGNSLIGSDFYAQAELPVLDDEARIKINAFDWTHEFKPIMDAGGFDAVVGNPPYDVMEKERGGASWPHDALAGYARVKSDLSPALGGKLNLFRFFLVQKIRLCRTAGKLGLIMPMAILGDISCANTRRHVLGSLTNLKADCFPQKDNAARRVFRDAKLSTVVLTGSKRASPEPKRTSIHIRIFPWNSFHDTPREATITSADLNLIDPENTPVPLVSAEQLALCRKIHTHSGVSRLGDVQAFEVNRGEINQTIYRDYISSNTQHTRLLKGVEIGRYTLHTQLKQGIREWFDEKSFLKTNTPRLVTTKRRIATQRITGVDERLRIVATLIEPGIYFADSTNSISLLTDDGPSLEYLLPFLNSRLWQWRFKLTSSNNNVGTNELKCMPLPVLDCSKKSSRAQHDALIAHVERMLKLHADHSKAKTPGTQTYLQRDIAATDRAIDALIYQLYGLTDDEIKLVEQATDPAATNSDNDEPDVPAAPQPADYSPQAEADAAHHYLAKEDPPKEN